MQALSRSALFVAILAVGSFAQETVTYAYNGRPLPILYSTTDFTIAEIVVPRPLRISTVTVRVQVDYPQLGDLNVFLFSPFGTRTRLLERNCGAVSNIDTTFADSAPSKFSSFCPSEPGRGPFQPNDPLGNFRDQTSFGFWRLAVQNNGSQGLRGSILGFAVTITGTVQTGPIFTGDTIVNDASGIGGAVAPGAIMSIYGSGLGPTRGVAAPAGNLPTTLGGTTVIFDGIPAPLYYASANQVAVQVPYAEIVGTIARIQVVYNDQGSPIISLVVRTAIPGLYTSGPGTGQIKAVNQDGTINSTANPAPKGSYVSVYASGLGDTAILIPSGLVVPDSPLIPTFWPIEAYVGGVQTNVQYSGLAPRFVGLYQVNLLIPSNVASGAQDVVLVAVNGASSQLRATIQVQ